MFLNVEVTRHLAEFAGRISRSVSILRTDQRWRAAKENIFFILISTDYVFDGKNPPYKEDATPNPLQAYGKSKYEAELVTQKASKSSSSAEDVSRDKTLPYTTHLDHVILRVPLLYGEVETLDENAVTILFKNIQSTDSRVKMDE